MKFWIAICILALLASELQAFKVKDKLIDKKNWNKDDFLRAPKSAKKFDLGKTTIVNVEKPDQIKIREFDLNFKDLNAKTTLRHPAAELKLDQFKAPETKLHASVKHQVPDDFFDETRIPAPKHKVLKMTPNEFSMKLEKKPFHYGTEKEEIPKAYLLHKHSKPHPQYHSKPIVRKPVYSPNFEATKFDDAHRRLESLESKLHPDSFHASMGQFEEKRDYFNQGNKLMEAGFDRIDTKHIEKPYYDIYNEMNEMESGFDYLKGREKKLTEMEMFPTKKHFELESGRLFQGNNMINSGFGYMKKMNMEPQFGQLHTEFGRLGQGRKKLDASEDYLKHTGLNEGFAKLTNRDSQLEGGVQIIDQQFENLQDNELGERYEALENNYDDLDEQHSFLSGIGGSGLKGQRIGSGFDFMQGPASQFGTGFVKGGKFPGFSGFGKTHNW